MRTLRMILIGILVLLMLTGATVATQERPGDILDDEWTLRDDIPVTLDIDGIEWSAALYQNNEMLRIVFYLEDESAKPVKTTLEFDPVYFLMRGMPVVIDTFAVEKKEIDYKFINDKMIYEVEVTNYPKILEMKATSRKLGNRGELTTEDRIKQARTLRRIRPQIDSWSKLASGQIIAQKTLKPIICHAGYDINGTKSAVIWANSKKLSGTFELLDATRNRQHPAPQPVVYTGQLKCTGFHIWGGNNYVADFSDFKTPGLYYLRLRVNETKEVVDSEVFPIKKNLYRELSKKAAGWYYYQRCGMEIPGFHKACHTQDTVIKLDGTKVDVSGGWHDAGDYGKWIGPTTISIIALANLQDELGDEFIGNRTAKPDVLDEAAWGAEYLCKGYWDGKFHAGFTADFEDVCTWLGAPEKEPPRIVTVAEMIENNYYGCSRGPGISHMGASLAKTGRLIRPYGDKELSDRCISVAKEVYELDKAVDLSKPEYEKKQNSYLWIQAGLLTSAIDLYKVTNDEKYQKDAILFAENLLALQDKDGSFFFDEARTSDKYVECRFHMLALYDFYKQNPGSSLNVKIKDAFKQWADLTMKFANLNNFGLIGGVNKDGKLVNIKYPQGNRRIGAFAWGLATAAILCDEPKYLEAAENQIQWITGFNPTDISMMAGVGFGPGCYHHRYCFMDGCSDGIVPGGILNGITEGTGKAKYLGDTDTKNIVIAEVPVDYPIIDTDVRGWTYVYSSNEYWSRNSAWFVLATTQIEKAMRKLH
ncbi:glycoside hydrolase family 9 protein [bacterium]|nr:glycoside hydrolase family 9 protein [bacterium]